MREVILPLCSVMVRPHLEYASRREVLSAEETWTCWSTSTRMTQGMEHLAYKDVLRELGLFSLEKRRLRGDLTAAFQYLKGSYRKEGGRLFSMVCGDRTRGNGFKLKE